MIISLPFAPINHNVTDQWKDAIHVVEIIEEASESQEPPTTEIYRGPAAGCLAAVQEWLRDPFGAAVVVKRVSSPATTAHQSKGGAS